MYGHGERPHQCYYAGCDRSQPGNGFPRRYNLFDHMKRMHDHKEDTANPSPAGTALGKAAIQSKSRGSKRRPNSPLDSAQPAQRPKPRSSRALKPPTRQGGYPPNSACRY
ncbi:hypothetical protein BDY17DRAFT_292003 [Neohortaea acidophila]|uniref:C2H2-domain containing protein second zinc finger domain-containing protein n=1 Tax=Neohortaea acidophila TaxID=245834 RepID=A0A6A6Q5N4_9PEZI|nr:uncharacterized protein BDY17DRAFT_292003 [Neohortaea acidophila]KAF2486727.1 hypothetical protein BDY17DRAFT_292003 [Neohortaea acidophila]